MTRYWPIGVLLCAALIGAAIAMTPPQPHDICLVTARVDKLEDASSIDDFMQEVTDHELEVTILSSALAQKDPGASGDRCTENRAGQKDYFKLCDTDIALKVGEVITGKEGLARGGGRYCITDVKVLK